uniref:Uncharacterized protein n=1 Tax=Panagrolaimus superbus TaxID=310955 RepID=A0A914YTY2_9BILA
MVDGFSVVGSTVVATGVEIIVADSVNSVVNIDDSVKASSVSCWNPMVIFFKFSVNGITVDDERRSVVVVNNSDSVINAKFPTFVVVEASLIAAISVVEAGVTVACVEVKLAVNVVLVSPLLVISNPIVSALTSSVVSNVDGIVVTVLSVTMEVAVSPLFTSELISSSGSSDSGRVVFFKSVLVDDEDSVDDEITSEIRCGIVVPDEDVVLSSTDSVIKRVASEDDVVVSVVEVLLASEDDAISVDEGIKITVVFSSFIISVGFDLVVTSNCSILTLATASKLSSESFEASVANAGSEDVDSVEEEFSSGCFSVSVRVIKSDDSLVSREAVGVV